MYSSQDVCFKAPCKDERCIINECIHVALHDWLLITVFIKVIVYQCMQIHVYVLYRSCCGRRNQYGIEFDKVEHHTLFVY